MMSSIPKDADQFKAGFAIIRAVKNAAMVILSYSHILNIEVRG